MSFDGHDPALRDLYNARLVALARQPFNSAPLPLIDREIRHDNPLCGDSVRLQLHFREERIAALSQVVRGCTICQAAACLIDRHAVGLDAAQMALRHRRLKKIIAEDLPVTPEDWPDFEIFRPLHGFRSRWTCALLPFQAMDLAFRWTDSTLPGG